MGVAPITDKLRRNWLRWYEYVLRRLVNAPIKQVENFHVENHRRGRGRLKKMFNKMSRTLQNDMSELGLSSLLGLDKTIWKGRIHVANPK